MNEQRDAPFFVGYLPAPKALRGWLIGISALLIVLFAAVSLAVGLTQDDPGPGSFRWDFGEQSVTGVIEAKPYPVLHVTEGSDKIPAGHTVMLAGQGKRGVMAEAGPLNGKTAQLKGILIKRGDLDMLQVGGIEAVTEPGGQTPAIAVEKLGRWKLAGEICDGKCVAGAMSPGRGLAHKACANLCLAGGAPPVFVSSKPVAGADFLLMAGPDGGPLPDWLYDRTAVYVTIEGEIEKRGDLLIFRVDPASIEVL
jgi:hypothetical protein